MKRAKVERSIAVVLFVAVLVTFSFAQRDSKKIDKLYTSTPLAGTEIYFAKLAAAATTDF